MSDIIEEIRNDIEKVKKTTNLVSWARDTETCLKEIDFLRSQITESEKRTDSYKRRWHSRRKQFSALVDKYREAWQEIISLRDELE